MARPKIVSGMNTHPLDPIYRAYDEGRAALLLTGRPLHDLAPDDDGTIRPLIESLRRSLLRRYGMALATYSLAGGFDWDEPRIADERDRRTLSGALRAHHLLDIPRDQNEAVSVIRGVSSLCSLPSPGRWADGREMRLGVLLEFAEHLTPGGMSHGTQTDAQLVAIELAHIKAQSLALRSSGNMVMFHAREGLVDELVAGALHAVRLPMAGEAEKRAFLDRALVLYPGARFEAGVDAASAAALTSNTTNRGLEGLVRASHRSGRPLTARDLVEQKSRDVIELSEGTLGVLDTRRAAGVDLCGRNVAAAEHYLEICAERLLAGDPSTPTNLLLAGAPGTGKTDLAILTAAHARVAAYSWISPKGGIVGETERRARLQATVAREWTPNICYADEITESLPLERSDHDGDSGASRSVMAALLTTFSDESRRGKSLFIASTNCPWRMGAAMRSRFEVVPVLQPLAEDFPAIIASTAHRVDPQCALKGTDAGLRDAAALLQQKGASPRHIRSSLSRALLLRGRLDADALWFAARDFTGAADHASAIYADLWALKYCSSNSFLPWSADPSGYPFPPHLAGLVRAGELDQEELSRRIEKYRPHANV